MNEWLLLITWIAPLIAALPLASTAARWALPIAALPAIAAVVFVPAGTTLELPWLLLGTHLGLDADAKVFLGFGAVLWFAAATFAVLTMHRDAEFARFRICFALAMGGNFGLIVGQDLVSFYLGFGLMGLAAYGLVIHDGNSAARRAGRIYLIMTIVGEIALFSGFVMLFARTGTLTPDGVATAAQPGTWELALLTLAFGIKGGLFGVHFWLPLAHPAAPVAASAVLSGAMIKAALIGWLRYLPLGQQAMPELGLVLIGAGVAGALLAVAIGVGQRDAKVVLAYSSIAKMAIMITAVGIAAAFPSIAPGILAAVVIYAAHHGLVKGALFLGVGVVKHTRGRWPLVLLVLPALALASLPYTSGAWAKASLSGALVAAPEIVDLLFTWLLPATTVGTTLLMARFLYLASHLSTSHAESGNAVPLPWLALLVAVVVLPSVLGDQPLVGGDPWLVLVTASIGILIWMGRPGVLTAYVGRVPPGDVVVYVESLTRHGFRLAHDIATELRPDSGKSRTDRLIRHTLVWRRTLTTGEALLRHSTVSGLAWLGVTGLTLLMLVYRFL